MEKENKQKFILIAILGIATILRFYKLGNYPALNADEASIGYDAYSLLETGRDQHGNSWPITFQSFNDYKPGLIVYLVMPFIKIFGLTVFWVRFLPAFLGIATVFMIFKLVKELSSSFIYGKKKSSLEIGNLKLKIEEVAAFFLAISPWHIHFSRGAWEVNISTFFITTGLYLFLKSLKNNKLFIFSTVMFVLSIYAYHAAVVVTPLIVIGILVIYRQDLFSKESFTKVLASGIIAFTMLIPIFFGFLSGNSLERASGIGLSADPGIAERTKEQQLEHFIDGGKSKYAARLIHNKYVNYLLAFGKNWTEHYNGNFLFVSGDGIQRNKIPDMGTMHLLDILWLAVGLVWIVRNTKNKGVKLTLYWLLIAPLAAAATFQSPHALRSQNMIIPLAVICSIGFVRVFGWISNKSTFLRAICYILLTTVFIWSFVFYLHQYFVHTAKNLPYSSQYGIAELVEFVDTNEYKDRTIIVSDRYDQPYVLFLFYLKYPPAKFQKEHVLTERDRFGFSTVREFDRFKFFNLDWDKDKLKYSGSLIAGPSDQIPMEANIVNKIYGTNGFEYFRVVAN